MNEPPAPPVRPTFGEAFRFWLKLGFISFGGPAGQIAIMHREVVEQKRWVDEAHFLHALNFCMLLPGPEAQQLATYLGWLLHRTWGALVAGALFVLPSAFILWGLSYVYMAHGNLWWLGAIFHGLKPAVLAIVVAAVLRIGGKALKNEVMWSLAALAFVAIRFFGAPFPLIIVLAALVGFFGGRIRRDKFLVAGVHGGGGKPEETLALDLREHAAPTLGRALRVTALGLGIWWLPVLAVGAWLGWGSTPFAQGLFFSKAALVTFGGAYAVLPYVGQEAVETYGWLTAPQMLDGLGLAETTPGPLIMVLQFVGFVGGWQHPGTLSPLAAATLGAAITTWTTFVPCFLLISLGAPYVERLRQREDLLCALSAITAAVVGVILNLAVWFGWQVLLPKAWAPDWFACAVAAVAFLGLQRWKWSVISVTLGAGLAGLFFVWGRGLF